MNANNTLAKALEVNKDLKYYGAFAEIGAGQEVARFFFQAGQASKTIAKTMSAYDMIYSDEIYGKEKSGRYVCESRVLKMLEKEYSLLEKRLAASRGDKTCFFAFADTVATGDQVKRYTHGWLGIRFQTKPKGPFNDIVMHIRMLDKYRLLQQEVLGVVGVNLVLTACFALKNEMEIVSHLVEDLKEGQVSIDLIRFSGPDVKHIDNHLINLELVKRGLAEAVMFGPDGEIVSASESLFKQDVIIQRGSFKPVTKTHIDVLEKGVEEFQRDFQTKETPMVLFELTMNSLEDQGKIDEKDFLSRVTALTALKRHVLVSNFSLLYKLRRFIRQYSEGNVVMIVGAYQLDKLFDDQFYKDLEGGLMEGFSKLLESNTKVFVYPHKTKDLCQTASTFKDTGKYKRIFEFFYEQGKIKDISGCDDISDYVHSHQVMKLIKKGDDTWEKYVPREVKDVIKKEHLFGV
jgi:hypothetical protein